MDNRSTSTALWLNPMEGKVPCADMDPFSPMYISLNIIVCVLVISGNVLTIMAVVKFRTLQTVTNTFIMSLAFADLTIGIILPMCSVLNHTTLIKSEVARKYMCYSCKTFTTISTAASLWNLLAIATDRFISVFWSLKYSIIMTQRRANFIIGIIWMYVLTFTVITIWLLHKPWQKETFCCLSQILPSSIYIYAFNLVMCVPITIFLHSRIFLQAYQQKKRIDAFHQVLGRTHKRNARITRMMAFVLGIFLLCWTPYTALNMVHKGVTKPPTWLTVLYKLSISVLYANSFMNPIIYGWRNTTFRRAFCRILHISNSEDTEETQITKNYPTGNVAEMQCVETPM